MQDLLEAIEEIAFTTEVEVHGDAPHGQVTINSTQSYFPNDRDDLAQAWEDFKDTIADLKKAGIYATFDLNTPPDWDFPEWEIIIELSRNQRFLKIPDEGY